MLKEIQFPQNTLRRKKKSDYPKLCSQLTITISTHKKITFLIHSPSFPQKQKKKLTFTTKQKRVKIIKKKRTKEKSHVSTLYTISSSYFQSTTNNVKKNEIKKKFLIF